MSPQVGGGVIVGQAIPAPTPNASKRPYLHRALSNVQNGTAERKLLLIGDSVVYGYNGPNGIGFAGTLATLLKTAGVPSSQGLVVPTNPNSASVDARWTVGASWAGTTNVNWAWGGQGPTYTGQIGAGSLVFTPTSGDTYDTYDIYYLKFPGFGTVNATVTGGAATPINTAAAAGVGKVTVTGTAAVNQVLTFSTVTVGQVVIFGVEPSLSTAKRLRIGNAGVTAASSASWIVPSAPNAGFGPLDCIAAYAADVAIIMLGINDVNSGVSLPQYLANLGVIANACAFANGCDIFLATEQPCQNGACNEAQLSSYFAALQSWATGKGYGFIDIFTAWGGVNGYNNLQPLGYYFDFIHPSQNIGYPDHGRFFADAILAA